MSNFGVISKNIHNYMERLLEYFSSNLKKEVQVSYRDLKSFELIVCSQTELHLILIVVSYNYAKGWTGALDTFL